MRSIHRPQWRCPRRPPWLPSPDRLVERRGEGLDASLARLREMANAHDMPLPQLLDELVADLHDQPSEDDSAILGLRWTS